MSFLDLMKNPKTFKRAVCKVSGTSFYNVDSIVKNLKQDMPVYLAHDPDNKYDRLALKVMVDLGDESTQIGFVPRPMNKDICVLLLTGVEVEARILSITPPRGDHSYSSIKIEVKVSYE